LLHRLEQRKLPPADAQTVAMRLDRPTPRVREGMLLRRFASSAIDISDGLLADLGHLLEASGTGALVIRDRLPVSDTYRAHLDQVGWDAALTGGDDYELCFTVPARHDAEFARWQTKFSCRVSCIGEVVSGPMLTVVDAQGNPCETPHAGYDHFR
jgi:thiamine-monophosphate kinase